MFAARRAVGTGVVSVVALIVALASAADAAAQSDRAVPDDPRATFVGNNATRCSHLEDDGVVNVPTNVIQLTGGGGSQNESASTPFVTGTVTRNVQTAFGVAPTALQVAITDEGKQAGVEIVAVVVKGGDGYNAYVDPEFLPPTLLPDQNYISPWVGEGGAANIAAISHWFVCYTRGEPPADDTLRVIKRVEPPVGEDVPLPAEYRVRVTCRLDGVVVKRRTFTFGQGGGSGTTQTGATDMTVPEGARCRVRELNTDALPPGCEVRYETPAARNPGVTVAGGAKVEVVNDCQDARVQRTGLDIVKRIVGFAPGELPDSFVVDVECTDGTFAQVTIPASGEPGTLDGIRVGEYCLVTERTGSLPPGLQVSYTINGVPSPVPGAADFQVVGDERITVTITNARSPSPPPPPPPEVPGEPTPEMDPVKTVRRGVIRAGERLRYTIEVRNRGRGVARSVVVCDRLPRAMTLISAPGSRLRNGQVCWRIARLRPLASREFTLVARANPRASGGATNVATADAPRTRLRTARVRITIRPQREELKPDAVTG
jgi:uncharacterized repeat protein (TIGR01451 family)